jgi:hypothetical protein
VATGIYILIPIGYIYLRSEILREPYTASGEFAMVKIGGPIWLELGHVGLGIQAIGLIVGLAFISRYFLFLS